ncbi:NUDIX hydrolase [Streptomyces sp. VRA16 Mangrove soil]|uniref:NUDIX hydrolase n=1 Tax=Streptomyces sp. VRA16 Mangrove soil TaxID=2817434 RepID=UPI0027DEA843|nr:NUDIX hydrolase [Streptomyces sp. VRA16 Mangrove soil]
MDDTARRAQKLTAYQKLAAERPALFVNPDGAPIRILLDAEAQQEVADIAAADARARGLPVEFCDIGVQYQDRYVTVVRDAVRFPGGVTGAYFRVCATSDGVGAAVLPLLDDGRIVLLRHFRHADRQWHWEMPRGFGEPGDDGAATARREVEEELGCPVRELIALGAMEADTGMAASRTDLYLARLEEEHFRLAPSPDARSEGITEVRAVPPEELERMLLDGALTDSFTLSALAFAQARRLL